MITDRDHHLLGCVVHNHSIYCEQILTVCNALCQAMEHNRKQATFIQPLPARSLKSSGIQSHTMVITTVCGKFFNRRRTLSWGVLTLDLEERGGWRAEGKDFWREQSLLHWLCQMTGLGVQSQVLLFCLLLLVSLKPLLRESPCSWLKNGTLAIQKYHAKRNSKYISKLWLTMCFKLPSW